MVSRSRRAFTLLELLLVIGILVILAASAVPFLIGRGKQARIDIVKSQIAPNGTIANALKQFHIDVGRFPTTEEGLAVLQKKPDDETLATHWKGPYIDPASEMKDPWGTDYQYECPGKNNTEGYDLSSAGPDRQHGNEDDINNWASDTGTGR